MCGNVGMRVDIGVFSFFCVFACACTCACVVQQRNKLTCFGPLFLKNMRQILKYQGKKVFYVSPFDLHLPAAKIHWSHF